MKRFDFFKKRPPERLTQKEAEWPPYSFYRANGEEIHWKYLTPICKIQTILVPNPRDISDIINEMSERGSASIPKLANAYVASDFNGETQHILKDESGNEKMFSVYAVQFYYNIME